MCFDGFWSVWGLTFHVWGRFGLQATPLLRQSTTGTAAVQYPYYCGAPQARLRSTVGDCTGGDASLLSLLLLLLTLELVNVVTVVSGAGVG